MKTSYFAKYKEADGVSIARSHPSGFKGETYADLAPPWTLVARYKNNAINEEEYIRMYHTCVLDKLDPLKVYSDLQDKVLLCWEGEGQFCHRRIVADWIYAWVGCKVEEV